MNFLRLLSRLFINSTLLRLQQHFPSATLQHLPHNLNNTTKMATEDTAKHMANYAVNKWGDIAQPRPPRENAFSSVTPLSDFKTWWKSIPPTGMADNVTRNEEVRHKQTVFERGGRKYEGFPQGKFNGQHQTPVNGYLKRYLTKLKSKSSRAQAKAADVFPARDTRRIVGEEHVDDERMHVDEHSLKEEVMGDDEPMAEEPMGSESENNDPVDDEAVMDDNAYQGSEDEADGDEDEEGADRRRRVQRSEMREVTPAERDRLRALLLGTRPLVAEGIANARSNHATSIRGLDPAITIPNLEHPGLRLTPHQLEAVGVWESMERQGRGVILGDDMGLGKTAVTAAVIQRTVDRANRAKRSILIGLVLPNSLIEKWKEFLRNSKTIRVCDYSNPSMRALSPTDIKRQFDLIIIPAGQLQHAMEILTRNFCHSRAIQEGFADEVARLLKKPLDTNAPYNEDILSMDLDQLIIDEAQSIKNPDTNLATAMRSLPARSRVALTSTPLQNRADEFGALLTFVRHRPFGNPNLFKSAFLDEGNRGQKLGEEAQRRRELNDAIQSSIRSACTIRRMRNQRFNGVPISDGVLPYTSVRLVCEQSSSSLDYQLKVKDLWNDPLRSTQVQLDKADKAAGNRRAPHIPKRGGKYGTLVALLDARLHIIHPALIVARYNDDVMVHPGDDDLVQQVIIERFGNEFSNLRDDGVRSEAREAFMAKYDVQGSNAWESDRTYSVVSQVVKRLKLHQAAANELPTYAERNEYIGSHKVLVYCEFIAALDLISIGLKRVGVKFQRLDGSVSMAKRDEVYKKFEEVGKVRSSCVETLSSF